MPTPQEVRLKYQVLMAEKPDPRDRAKMDVWRREVDMLRDWLRRHSDRKKERE